VSDDFFDDMDGMDDSFEDPSNDLQEDMFDEYGGLSSLVDGADPDSLLPDEAATSDHRKSIIMGSMIAGQAYSEAKYLNGQERLRRKMQELGKRKK